MKSSLIKFKVDGPGLPCSRNRRKGNRSTHTLALSMYHATMACTRNTGTHYDRQNLKPLEPCRNPNRNRNPIPYPNPPQKLPLAAPRGKNRTERQKKKKRSKEASPALADFRGLDETHRLRCGPPFCRGSLLGGCRRCTSIGRCGGTTDCLTHHRWLLRYPRVEGTGGE